MGFLEQPMVKQRNNLSIPTYVPLPSAPHFPAYTEIIFMLKIKRIGTLLIHLRQIHTLAGKSQNHSTKKYLNNKKENIKNSSNFRHRGVACFNLRLLLYFYKKENIKNIKFASLLSTKK